MELSTNGHGKCGYGADFSVHGIASAPGAYRGSPQRHAERVAAWEDEGGALPGGAAVGGSRAQAVPTVAALG